MIEVERRVTALVGLAAAIAGLALLGIMPDAGRTALRERVFDISLQQAWPASAFEGKPRIAIIDIDRASLAAVGPWPWPRGELARLVDVAAQSGAKAIVLDIIFSGPDQRSPGSVARSLARETANPALERIAATLADGDEVLAAAVTGRPTALAFVLDPQGGRLTSAPPVLIREGAPVSALWTADGAQGPLPVLAAAASGLGAASLPGDADGVVRRVPLLVRVGGRIASGLAAEAVRIAADASGVLVTGPALQIAVGEIELTLPTDGMLRLMPTVPAPRRVSAGDVIARRADIGSLKDAIVFIGASAPELGALRPSLFGPLTSPADLQARAAGQILAGISPVRVPGAGALETVLALAAAGLALLCATALKPTSAVAAIFGLVGLLLAFAIALALVGQLLDPLPALAAASAAFLAASLAAYAQTWRREAKLRRRFQQYLAPDVVRRLAAQPETLRLGGEKRQITALFSDIEGFAAMTVSAPPEALIAVLDRYLEGVATIVVEHGGMIDKFVGDAVHAFFNMPLDLDSHTDRAIACSMEINRWTEAYRREGAAASIGLGRTRIGVETGDAIVGNVGLATKLDYTAYGIVVNVASRLEALNKELGTTICIGPGAEACARTPLRSLGLTEVRGMGPLEIYTPVGC
jgi:adenylate cyclase